MGKERGVKFPSGFQLGRINSVLELTLTPSLPPFPAQHTGQATLSHSGGRRRGEIALWPSFSDQSGRKWYNKSRSRHRERRRNKLRRAENKTVGGQEAQGCRVGTGSAVGLVWRGRFCRRTQIWLHVGVQISRCKSQKTHTQPDCCKDWSHRGKMSAPPSPAALARCGTKVERSLHPSLF